MTLVGCNPLVHSSQVLVSSRKSYSSTLDFSEPHSNILFGWRSSISQAPSLSCSEAAQQCLLSNSISVDLSHCRFLHKPSYNAPHRKTELLRPQIDLGFLNLTGAGGCWELSQPQPLGAGDGCGWWASGLGQGHCERLSCKKTPWLVCVVSRWDWFI